jgi:hypothetical protein
MKNLLEKIDIMPGAILIETGTSKGFPGGGGGHIYTI